MIAGLSDSMNAADERRKGAVEGTDSVKRDEPEHLGRDRGADHNAKQVSKAVENVNERDAERGIVGRGDVARPRSSSPGWRRSCRN